MESSLNLILRRLTHRRVFAVLGICLSSTILTCTMASLAISAQVAPDDADALRGMTVGKVVFDINTTDPKTLAGYLKAIEQTHDDMLRQKVTPDIILAFRGVAVTFISKDRKRFDPQKSEVLDEIADRIKRLHQKGVRLESCAIAMRGNQVNPDILLDGIKAVGNTFISLTGYQMKGYSVISIY